MKFLLPVALQYVQPVQNSWGLLLLLTDTLTLPTILYGSDFVYILSVCVLSRNGLL